MVADLAIPRRSCVADLDATPGLWELFQCVDFYVGGVKTGEVTAYDMDAGTLERLVSDERGNIMLDEAGEDAAHETLTGEVTIVRREPVTATASR